MMHERVIILTSAMIALKWWEVRGQRRRNLRTTKCASSCESDIGGAREKMTHTQVTAEASL